MASSAVSFFRKHLKVRGQSQHSGRGFYIMDMDCSLDELNDRVEDMIAKLGDKVVVTRERGSVRVALKGDIPPLTTYYRTFVYNPQSIWPAIVWM